jgi:NADPH:quinone reductase-like Zn-dependent oxidoreductase
MRAKKVVITEKGTIDSITVQEFDIPEVKENEVLIKVTYAGLGYGDIMARKLNIPGLPKVPFTPGSDVTGIVESVGTNVTNVKPGESVAALLMPDYGGQSEFVLTSSENIFKIPDNIPLDKAACLPINYLTAYGIYKNYLQNELNFKRVLYHGGSGGVGSAFIQIAVSKGMKVLTTASNKNHEFLTALGAEPIDYNSSDFSEYVKSRYSFVDAVIDPIAGDYTKRSLKILRDGGKYIGIGFQTIKNRYGMIRIMLSFLFRKMFTSKKEMYIYMLNSTVKSELNSNLNELFNMYKNGEIDPVISAVYTLDNVKSVHEKLESGDRKGKILIKLN